jgi:hypothetical protein
MVLPFRSYFSKSINVLRKLPKKEVDQPILQVGFQLFSEIPHCLFIK